MRKNKCFLRFWLALGISLALFAGVCCAQWTSKGPAPRLGHSAVLDTAKDKMIVFARPSFRVPRSTVSPEARVNMASDSPTMAARMGRLHAVSRYRSNLFASQGLPGW